MQVKTHAPVLDLQSSLVGMLVRFTHMARMVMFVRTMFSCMLMAVGLIGATVRMFMAVFVMVSVRMGVGMLVTVFLSIVRVLMRVGMAVLMFMLMSMFMFPFHNAFSRSRV